MNGADKSVQTLHQTPNSNNKRRKFNFVILLIAANGDPSFGPIEPLIITYVVQPGQLPPWWVRFDVALKVDVIALFDVIDDKR
jgi:hypothetical protein